MAKKEINKSVSRGLNILRFGYFCNNLMFVIPVIVLVYTQKGITVGDFFLIQGIFRLAAFLFEIPSGYMSDCFSRKNVLITGTIFSFLGFSALALANGFFSIMLGEALLGIASALNSGTLEAYTYDLMKRNKSQKQFIKEFGSIMTFGSTASFIASIFGGILFVHIGGDNILWLEASFVAIGMAAFIFLPQLTEIKRKLKHTTAIKDAFSITYNTIKNPKLRNLIFFPALLGAFTVIMLWILQPIMENTHVPVELFGFYIGLNQFSRIIFSKYAYKICDKYGDMNTSIITILDVAIGIVVGILIMHTTNMTLVYILCTIMAITPAIHSMNKLQYNSLIHHSIRSTERGTVLSTKAMVTTVVGAVFLIVAKFLLDECGILTTLGFTFIMLIPLVWSLKKVSKFLYQK
ncbi:MAG: MFS transporter [Alphaproteobacteria bacterium]|nr:MFS transporter [Alphaproteobacteria bacterium]